MVSECSSQFNFRKPSNWLAFPKNLLCVRQVVWCFISSVPAHPWFTNGRWGLATSFPNLGTHEANVAIPRLYLNLCHMIPPVCTRTWGVCVCVYPPFCTKLHISANINGNTPGWSVGENHTFQVQSYLNMLGHQTEGVRRVMAGAVSTESTTTTVKGGCPWNVRSETLASPMTPKDCRMVSKLSRSSTVWMATLPAYDPPFSADPGSPQQRLTWDDNQLPTELQEPLSPHSCSCRAVHTVTGKTLPKTEKIGQMQTGTQNGLNFGFGP